MDKFCLGLFTRSFFFFKQKTEYNFQGMIYLTCQVQKGDANQDVLPSSAVPFLSESFTGES